MVKQVKQQYGEEYGAVRPPSVYPNLLIGGLRNMGSTLAAEAAIKEWQNRPEYKAQQDKLAEVARQKDLAEATALFDALRARHSTAAPATAIADVAEVANGQADEVERVIGTV